MQAWAKPWPMFSRSGYHAHCRASNRGGNTTQRSHAYWKLPPEATLSVTK